jgi:hypothetical protein
VPLDPDDPLDPEEPEAPDTPEVPDVPLVVLELPPAKAVPLIIKDDVSEDKING